MREVTDQMVTIYKIRCMGLIQNDAGTLAKLYSNAFSRHYAGPADAIGKNGGTRTIASGVCVCLFMQGGDGAVGAGAGSALLFFFGNCTRACARACVRAWRTF